MSGGLAQGPGESKPTTTTTTPTPPKWRVEAKPRIIVAPKGRWEGAPKGFRREGPKAPSHRVWVQGLGLWGLGFRQFGQNTKTLKLAKVEVCQHIKTIKLDRVGLAKVGQAHNCPK